MNKILTITLMVFISSNSIGQIDCEPTLGFAFKPIKKGISLYKKPDLDSNIALKSPSANNVWLRCTNADFINDFVEVEVEFIHGAFEENGVNSLLLDLYQYLTTDYQYSFNFREFSKFINIEKNQKIIYDLLINDETNDWFKDYSSRKEYDVSTFEGFYRNWIFYDKSSSSEDYIFDNQKKIVYVHKSHITNEGTPTLILNGENSDYYLKLFNEQIDLKNDKSCFFTEDKLLYYFEYYANALIKEGLPFKVIQEANKFSYHFENFESINTLSFLKMNASYFDENYKVTINIGEKLIDLYNTKKITNSNDTYGGGDIDMSRVYAMIISSLLQTEKYNEALVYSKKCDLNRKLQFKQHIQFYAISMLNLGKESEACEILNEAYLNGNQSARDLLKKHCE